MIDTTFVNSSFGMPEYSASRLQRRPAIDARCLETWLAI